MRFREVAAVALGKQKPCAKKHDARPLMCGSAHQSLLQSSLNRVNIFLETSGTAIAVSTTADRPCGKYIGVTAINPTQFGEGKTVVSIGQAMALQRRGHRSIVTLRQPWLAPVLGIKGQRLGRPAELSLPVHEVRLAAGAGVILVIAGDITLMPGLPRTPAATRIDVTVDGEISGLYLCRPATRILLNHFRPSFNPAAKSRARCRSFTPGCFRLIPPISQRGPTVSQPRQLNSPTTIRPLRTSLLLSDPC